VANTAPTGTVANLTNNLVVTIDDARAVEGQLDAMIFEGSNLVNVMHLNPTNNTYSAAITSLL
jgi:uncharacterized protein (DUF2141 family)